MSKYLKEWIFVVVIMSLGMTAIAYSSWPTKKDKGTFGNVVIDHAGVIDCSSYFFQKTPALNGKENDDYDVEISTPVQSSASIGLSPNNFFEATTILKCFQIQHPELEIWHIGQLARPYNGSPSTIKYNLRFYCHKK